MANAANRGSDRAASQDGDDGRRTGAGRVRSQARGGLGGVVRGCIPGRTIPPTGANGQTPARGAMRFAGLDAEAVVVGGGPAGSVLAAELAALGHDVLLLDKARFPRHKACSDYVNPAGVRLLESLGLGEDLRRLGAHRAEGMRVYAPGGARYLADFASAEPGRTAMGLTRRQLDALLLDRAKAAGARVVENAHVRSVLAEGRSARGVEATIGGARQPIRAALVVGADGRASAVSRRLGLDVPSPLLRRTGLVAHFRGIGGLERFGEMHVGAHGYAGLAPLEDGLTNVAFVSDAATVAGRPGALEAYFEAGLRALPAAWARVSQGERIGPIRGVGPMAHRTRRCAGDGFLLVGDAAGFLDPFTGEGVAEALGGALLAAPVASAALRSGGATAAALEPYREARRRAFWSRRGVGWLVQGFIGRPWLLDYATPRLADRPGLGDTLAGVLGDMRPARQALSPVFLARLLRP